MSYQSNHLPALQRARLARAGSTLVETLVALVISVVFLSSVYASNSRVWALVKSSLESNSGNRTVNGRAEQLRASTWDQVTNPTYLRDTVFAVAPDAGGDIAGLLETIDVIAYLPPTPSTPPQPNPAVATASVTRSNATGTATIAAPGGAMTSETSVRVNLTATWTSTGRLRTRQVSMMFAPGGVSGRR